MKKTVSRLVKLVIVAALILVGIGTVIKMPEAVQSFLPRVETIRATEMLYSPTVNAQGKIGKSSEFWYAIVTVSEGDINYVREGQSAKFRGAALEDGVYVGEVINIASTAHQLQSMVGSETVVDVTLKLTNGDQNLREGYTVQADIRTAPDEVIFILPYSAICQDDDGEYVYVLSKSTAERRNIVTGRELSSGAEIVSGISANDEIIAEPSKVYPDCYVLRSEE